MRTIDADALKQTLLDEMNFDENCQDSVFDIIDSAPTVEKRKEMTLGEFLDLIDSNRDSEEFVRIMGSNGYYVMRAMVCFDNWGDLEQRPIAGIGIECGEYQVWLKH